MPPPPDRRRRSGAAGKPPSGRAGTPSRKPGAPSRGESSGRSGGRPDRPDKRGSASGKKRPRSEDRRSSSTGRPSGRVRQGGTEGDRPGKSGDRRRDEARGRSAPVQKPAGRAGSWGGVARRAAGAGGSAAPPVPARGRMADAPASRAAEAFQSASGHQGERFRIERDPEPEVRDAAKGAVRRGSAPERSRARPGPTERDTGPLTEALGPVVGSNTAPRLAERLADASRAYGAERYVDARRMLATLVSRAPASAAVRELYGLTLYRLGRWGEAVRELEAFRSLTHSTEQHPVLADSYRALGRYDAVEALWRELREVSPSAELVAEGRIVFAGSLADRGMVREAIAAIEPAVRRVRSPKDHHLRLLYVLADLYERAGDQPRARTLFDRLVAIDPGFADAAERRRAL